MPSYYDDSYIDLKLIAEDKVGMLLQQPLPLALQLYIQLIITKATVRASTI